MTQPPPLALPARTLARTAGLLYLLIAITGAFAQIVRTDVIDANDATRTAANLLDAERLFRLGIASDLITFSAEVVLALVIFALFRPVNAPLALLAAFLRLAQGTALAMNMGNQVAALRLVTGRESTPGLDPTQADALALLSLQAHSDGYLIGLIFFALQNIVLGYLIVRSSALPRLLGFLVMTVASTGYLVDSIGNLLVPDYPAVISTIALTPAVIVEIALIVWLLARWPATRQDSEPAWADAAAPA